MIDTNSIVQLKIDRKDVCLHHPNDNYWIKTITIHTLEENKNHIESVIKYHHEDLIWDGITTLEIVKERIEFGSILHLMMFKNKSVGWFWANSNCISIDWKSYYNNLDKDAVYVGGAFLSRKNKPSKDSAFIYYRQGIDYILDFHKSDIMYLYSDDWNRASAILCYKCGFSKYNFLKEE